MVSTIEGGSADGALGDRWCPDGRGNSAWGNGSKQLLLWLMAIWSV